MNFGHNDSEKYFPDVSDVSKPKNQNSSQRNKGKNKQDHLSGLEIIGILFAALLVAVLMLAIMILIIHGVSHVSSLSRNSKNNQCESLLMKPISQTIHNSIVFQYLRQYIIPLFFNVTGVSKNYGKYLKN